MSVMESDKVKRNVSMLGVSTKNEQLAVLRRQNKEISLLEKEVADLELTSSTMGSSQNVLRDDRLKCRVENLLSKKKRVSKDIEDNKNKIKEIDEEILRTKTLLHQQCVEYTMQSRSDKRISDVSIRIEAESNRLAKIKSKVSEVTQSNQELMAEIEEGDRRRYALQSRMSNLETTMQSLTEQIDETLLSSNKFYSDRLEIIKSVQEFGAMKIEDTVIAKKEATSLKLVEKKKKVYKKLQHLGRDERADSSFEDFMKKFLDGSLKSEALPEKNDGPVKVAVAQNFQELVVDNDKDILIEFYAPWCGHCKKLAPTFEELGQEMQEEDVEIVKMDSSTNDVPLLFLVHGFPTLYWVPKTHKTSPKKYEGGREVKDFVEYIAKHATDELKGYDRSGKKKSSKVEL